MGQGYQGQSPWLVGQSRGGPPRRHRCKVGVRLRLPSSMVGADKEVDPASEYLVLHQLRYARRPPSSTATTELRGLDRLVHNAHRIDLAGDSLRRRRFRTNPRGLTASLQLCQNHLLAVRPPAKRHRLLSPGDIISESAGDIVGMHEVQQGPEARSTRTAPCGTSLKPD
jgi:hypothetical protein